MDEHRGKTYGNMRIRERRLSTSQGEQLQNEIHPANTLILDFQLQQSVRKLVNLLLKPPRLWDFVVAALVN